MRSSKHDVKNMSNLIKHKQSYGNDYNDYIAKQMII